LTCFDNWKISYLHDDCYSLSQLDNYDCFLLVH